MKRSLQERDRQVIWHPYTQHKDMPAPIPVVRGKGSLLFDENGRSYIDAISSWWVTIHGHGHPYIAQKVYEQALALEQVIFTGFTHEPAVHLAERLTAMLPGDFSRVFYSDNGSTAVEVAIKMAVQYWKNRENPSPRQETGHRGDGNGSSGQQSRRKILAFSHAYHGDTFGAMSVSGRSVFTGAFEDYLFGVLSIDLPSKQNIGELKSFIRDHGDEIACFIYEPLLQGAGGMRMVEPGLLDELLQTAAEAGILLIADEVLTGFGRTGRSFASGWLKQQADIMCLSKGLTGGTMALGVTAATEKIFGAFLSADKTKTLFHGHSFTANPIACSAALASLDLLEEEDCRRRIEWIGAQHHAFARRISGSPAIKNLRILGTVLAFELNTGKDEYINSIGATLTSESLRSGIYLRPLGNTVYIMPPYCISPSELSYVYDFLAAWLTTKGPMAPLQNDLTAECG